jgi:hypothetical protein
MFNLTPTAQDIKDKDRLLTIAEASLRSPKAASCIISFVDWGTYDPVFIEAPEFLDCFAIAVPPKLPHGYKMEWHKSWEELSILANDKMVALCKIGDLKQINDFDNLFHDFIKSIKKTYFVDICSYYDCIYNGHEEPNYPDNLARHAECEATNKTLQTMTGADMYRQLKNLSPQSNTTSCWVDDSAIAGITKDGRTINLKDSTVPLTEIVSIQMGVISERDMNDPIFDW